jgi:hypothetical protein
MTDGYIWLHRFNGVEKYSIKGARMFLLGESGERTLWFEVEAERNGAIRNEDTKDYPAHPKMELGIDMEELPDELLGQQFCYEYEDWEEDDSCKSLIYYYSHQPLRSTQVTILSKQGERYSVRWTAVTQDVNYYDGSKEDTRIEVEAIFSWSGK